MQEFEGPTQRGAIQNTDSGEILKFPFNPTEWSEEFAANYAHYDIPGLSYQPMQYTNNTNNAISLEIYLSGVKMDSFEGTPGVNVIDIRNYLQSLLVPTQSAVGGWTAPPQLLFVWPHVVAGYFVATKLSFGHKRFQTNLETLVAIASLDLEALNVSSLFSQKVRKVGVS